MKSVCVAGLLSLVSTMACATSVSCPVPDSVWTLPRSGAQVLSLPALQPCWNALRVGGEALIEHRIDEGARVNAAELQDWAIAFGVDSRRMTQNDVQLSSTAVTLIVNNKPVINNK